MSTAAYDDMAPALAASIAASLAVVVGGAARVTVDGPRVLVDDLLAIDCAEPAYRGPDVGRWAKNAVFVALVNAQDIMAEITTEPWPWRTGRPQGLPTPPEPHVDLDDGGVVARYGNGHAAVHLPPIGLPAA
jgi:hypothetical protein